eukprot:1129277-Alexandrium_andersonii.AAC.1
MAVSSESGDLPPQLGWYQSGCSRMWATATDRTRSGPPWKSYAGPARQTKRATNKSHRSGPPPWRACRSNGRPWGLWRAGR